MDRLEQTICALATPPGEGGIAVIRVSGPDAYPIVEKIFVPVRQGRRVADAKGYTAMLGHYLLRGEEMDETVALFYRAPHSYTGEDVIELSVHGGTAMADGLLEALLLAGAAPAGQAVHCACAYRPGAGAHLRSGGRAGSGRVCPHPGGGPYQDGETDHP